MARLHRRRERGPTCIGSLLTEQANQCSQEEKEGKMTFHTDTVGRGGAGVNDMTCRARASDIILPMG